MLDHSLRKALGIVAAVTATVLLVPLIAMQLSTEVDWGPGDFVLAACLLFITGTAMALAVRHTKRRAHRVVLVGSVALAFAVVWAELAVGLFD